ncbi:ribose transport system substrate-binding protein [Marmoricola sp. URHA0025 HA25]
MNRMPRTLAVGALAALTALSLAACNTEDTKSSTSSGSKELTIGLANQQMSVTFPAAIAKGAQAEAKKLGVKLVVLDSQGDQAKQASQVQDLIGQKVDGIILVPLSPGPAQAMVDQADAAGIAVGTAHGYVGADRSVDDPYEKLKYVIDEDEAGAGATAGKMAVEAVPNGGDVAIITGAAGFVENKTRVDDFEKALTDKGGFKVVANQPGDWTKEGGQSACQNILAAHPKVSLFYAISDDMAVGCAAAAKSAGSSAKIIGVGGSAGGIDAIKAGTVYGTVCYKPYTEGQMAVKAMVDALKGNLSGAPKTTFYDTPGVTKANVDSCQPQW